MWYNYNISPGHNHLPWFFITILTFSLSSSALNQTFQTAFLSVNVSSYTPISPTFFGIFFEEINHAGAGGLWAEMVDNRGFEFGGRHSPSVIKPWDMIGDEKSITITTELSSCFRTNPVALRIDVHCDKEDCPPGGVGVYNPGFNGMNVEKGKTYNVVFYVQSSGPLDAVVSLMKSDGTQVLGFRHIEVESEKVKNWTRMELKINATGSNTNSSLQFTTTRKGTIWLDQVSVMPTDTYKEHGFRTDLMEMLLNLKPSFLRFPGGCYVEGGSLNNAFRWKETVGPWEERPGHYGDVWRYWTDDGLGYLEYLQLAEDLGAEPIWVINSGMSTQEQVDTHLLSPYVQEMLDSIEFARGSPDTKWGSFRAKLGHPAPFSMKYVAIGNENCDKEIYKGNYHKFYHALKDAYPDIKAISNCDATNKTSIQVPADIFDYHKYTNATDFLHLTHLFDDFSRDRGKPKVFVSEYAVTHPTNNGTFKGALAEAAFLLSLERNSDVVEMVSYAPLFFNDKYHGRYYVMHKSCSILIYYIHPILLIINHFWLRIFCMRKSWKPDAIVFNSNKVFGIPSYWVQTFFKESNGAFLFKSHLQKVHQHAHIYATAITWTDEKENKTYIRIKVVNFQKEAIDLNILIEGIDSKSTRLLKETSLTSDDLDAENTFDNIHKVVPKSRTLKAYGNKIGTMVKPYSFTALDFINDSK